MAKILVSGLINIETTVKVDSFPVQYTPVRYPFYGVNSTVSGVGYNVVKALTTLGDEVPFLSLTGQDPAGRLARETLREAGISDRFVLERLASTPQSAILYESGGRRQINLDLKDIQDKPYPQDVFDQAVQGCSLAVLCNINFSRPFLEKTRRLGIPIATDVHAVSDLEDGYNRDFMESADILFMSDDLLPCPAEEWARRILDRFRAEVVVVGLGAQGALLAVRSGRFIERLPAVTTRPVVNTIGAGDALFSSFVHFYLRSQNPVGALRKAVVFASYKIGVAGAADGFLDEPSLDQLLIEKKIY